jgi:drug/metabolite transporter (DMT)-like permease
MFSTGVRYMLLAGFFFATMNLLVKSVSHIHAIEIVFFRSLVSFVMSFVMLRYHQIPLFGKNYAWLIARGGIGAIALTLFFITLQLIPLASAVTIQFLSPIFTTIIGIFMLRERIHTPQWFFFAIAFTGVLVIQGFDARVPLWIALMGVGSALASGIAYNIIRKLKTDEHPLVIVFYFPLVTMPLAGIYAAFNWSQPQGWDWLALLGIGILTQYAQLYMTKAYQLEKVAKVASINYFGIIYALGYGYVFFQETYDFSAFFGILLVLIGLLANLWYRAK